jgi:hypothetical protein
MTEISRGGAFLWGNPTADFLQNDLTPDTTSLNLSTCHVNEASGQLITSVLQHPDSKLARLVLNQCRMTVATSISIFQAIPGSRLAYLSMDGNVLTADACRAFGKTLTDDPPLEYASLKRCEMPSDGAGFIAEALPRTTHLRFLFLDSNCIFDRGLDRLSRKIDQSSLVGLSIQDNQIWEQGTSALLNAITSESCRLCALDLSYNMVNLALLSACLKKTPRITQLAISGCKVHEGQFLHPFLEDLGKTELAMLIVEGLNFKELPISWPKVSDTIWANRQYFELLGRALRASQRLCDLRFGFLDLDQLNSLAALGREMTITISDFGRTGATWVAHFPDFSVEAPTTTLQWATRIGPNGAPHFGALFRSGSCDGRPLDSINIQGISVTDSILQHLLESFGGAPVNLRLFDLSNNEFGDMSVETLTPLFETSTVDELLLARTKMTEFGFQRFFRFFARDHPDRFPRVIRFSFGTQDTQEAATHQFFNDLGSLVSENCPLEELTVAGSVTAVDLTVLIGGLAKNSNLRKIVIQSEVPEKYKVPDPPIDAAVLGVFSHFVRILHAALTEPNALCRLDTFVYPVLTAVFLVGDEMQRMWVEIEAQLKSNRNE